MITLLHGDDIVASRQELTQRIQEAKNDGKELRWLDGRTLTNLSLAQAIESPSLFGGELLVVIDGLFRTFGKKEKRISTFTDILKRSAQTTETILWEEKEIIKSLIALLGSQSSIKLFKTPVIIWELLDSIRPGNRRVLIPRLQQALAHHAAELIFTLLVRRVRQLIIVRDGKKPEGLQEWQVMRLTRQAKSFTMGKLLTMEKRLLEIDISIKTGASPFPLPQLMELFIVDMLYP